MKRKDLTLIITVIIVTAVLSFILCSMFIGGKNKPLTAEVVKPVSSEFNLPSEKIFNTNAINPTRQIEIGPNTNDQPFDNE